MMKTTLPTLSIERDTSMSSTLQGQQSLPAGLRLSGVSKAFDGVQVLHDVGVHLPSGQFSVLLGPSGCGKSTLLRMIAGLDMPSAGKIQLQGRDITTLSPAAREIAMVFQSYALFPHLSVAQNILFGLSVRRVPRAEQAARLARVAGMMGLEALLSRKPAQLSGGQQQRVALARAVISEKPVCLMDEPLSNLDAKLRAEMRGEIRALQQRLGLTMVYVTHDQIEAMTMGDRIVVMNEGRVQQIGTPQEIYTRPATAFCARFIGTPPMNLVPLEDLMPEPGTAYAGLARDTLAGLRPEEITVTTQSGLQAEVIGVEYHGADQLVTVRVGASHLAVRLPARHGAPGTSLRLNWAPESLHLFDGATGQRLPDRE